MTPIQSDTRLNKLTRRINDHMSASELEATIRSMRELREKGPLEERARGRDERKAVSDAFDVLRDSCLALNGDSTVASIFKLLHFCELVRGTTPPRTEILSIGFPTPAQTGIHLAIESLQLVRNQISLDMSELGTPDNARNRRRGLSGYTLQLFGEDIKTITSLVREIGKASRQFRASAKIVNNTLGADGFPKELLEFLAAVEDNQKKLALWTMDLGGVAVERPGRLERLSVSHPPEEILLARAHIIGATGEITRLRGAEERRVQVAMLGVCERDIEALIDKCDLAIASSGQLLAAARKREVSESVGNPLLRVQAPKQTGRQKESGPSLEALRGEFGDAPHVIEALGALDRAALKRLADDLNRESLKPGVIGFLLQDNPGFMRMPPRDQRRQMRELSELKERLNAQGRSLSEFDTLEEVRRVDRMSRGEGTAVILERSELYQLYIGRLGQELRSAVEKGAFANPRFQPDLAAAVMIHAFTNAGTLHDSKAIRISWDSIRDNLNRHLSPEVLDEAIAQLRLLQQSRLIGKKSGYWVERPAKDSSLADIGRVLNEYKAALRAPGSPD